MKINLSIKIKLFGAFFMILVIVVGAMTLSRYLFSLNFRTYIHQMEIERLEAMVPALKAAYQRRGNWDQIAANPGRWQHLMRMAPGFPERRPAPSPPQPGAPGGVPAAPGAAPPDMGPGGPPDLFLLNADDAPVIGHAGRDAQRHLVAIEVDGRVVGWLGLQRREPLESGPPAVLMQRQNRQFYLIGGLVIGLTALIAFLFSRYLLKPVHQLTRGTRELSRRNFTARIESTRRDELGQLAENFNTMAAALETYEEMRQQWITDISHELRTPLAVLRGEIEALQDGVRQPSAGNLASLHAEILRLGKLVEDLHLLSAADTDHLWLERVPMRPAAVLEETVAAFRPRFARQRIDIDLAATGIEKARIRGDRNRLSQVFANIFENVLKYVPSPGLLRISGAMDDNVMVLRFEDSGPGVPEAALPKLFDRLYRVDRSRSRETGGSGLGLSICRRIIESHDGHIRAVHGPMGGLSIVIELPLANRK